MDSFLICIRPFFLSALNMIPYEELYPTPIHTSVAFTTNAQRVWQAGLSLRSASASADNFP